MEKIQRAIKESGGASRVAREMGVSPQVVCNWAERGVPIERAARFEAVTGLSRRELRPDDWQTIWPELEPAQPGLPLQRVAATLGRLSA